jgi:hypothetical protein
MDYYAPLNVCLIPYVAAVCFSEGRTAKGIISMTSLEEP